MNNFTNQTNAIVTIAYRDIIKFIRDPRRIIATFVFPFIFVGVLGSSLEANLGDLVKFDFLTFTFTGVFTQVLFQSTASGIISLIEDRENDFAQELFIAPVSRYIIVIGKIVGESGVSLIQAIGVILFGLIIGVDLTPVTILTLAFCALVATSFGGAFGVMILGNLDDQRTANQIFPFVLFPQIFLAGVFSPIQDLPWLLLILSRAMPLTYLVDFVRHLFYWNSIEKSAVTVFPLWLNMVIISFLFIIFIAVGTFLFVRNTIRE